VDWTFLYLMLFLKLPILALLWIVWWAVRDAPDEAEDDEQGGGGDGGVKLKRPPVHPRRPFPRTPRRGPHGDPAPPSPPRTRTVLVRARETARR